MEKIQFISTQFAIFFDESIRPEIFISNFAKEMGDIFDQSPLTVPVPTSPEFDNVPTVQFLSSNGLYSCSFARKRADYYHFSSDRKKQYTFTERKDTLIANIEKYFKFFREKENVSINRIGFLTKFFVKDDQDGKVIANLVTKELKEAQGGNTRNAGIQYTSRIKTKDNKFEINNITTIEKARINLYEDSREIPQDGILITRDFNTIPENAGEYKGKLTVENIKEIIAEGEKSFNLNEILNLL